MKLRIEDNVIIATLVSVFKHEIPRHLSVCRTEDEVSVVYIFLHLQRGQR